jgi:predicted ATPase
MSSFDENVCIGIEGPSFSGKTTLLKDLVRTKIGKNVVLEHDVYAGGANNFRSLPFINKREAEMNIFDFINWEKERRRDAEILYSRNKQPVFFDRTILSVILLQKLLHDYYPKLYNSYHFSIKPVIKFIRKKEVILPSRIIIMKPTTTEVFLKRRKRGVSVHLFSEEINLHRMNKLYNDISKIIYPQRHLVLKSNNGLYNRLNLVIKVLNFKLTPIQAYSTEELSMKLLKYIKDDAKK